MKKTKITSLIILLAMCTGLYSQSTNDSIAVNDTLSRAEIITALKKGIVVPLDRKGKSWMKFLVFSQMTGMYNDAPRINATAPASTSTSVLNFDRQEKNFEMGLDRARFITAANFFDKVFVFSQFGTAGLGGINNDNMNTFAQNKESQLSLLTFYTELNASKAFNIGTGLHNYKGISRFNNAGLVDLIPQNLDLSLLPTFGLNDQFSYNLGVFVKGIVGKIRYQFSVDEASRQNIATDLYNNVSQGIAKSTLPPELKTDALNPLAPNKISAVYRGSEILGGAKAGTTFSGYVNYHFLDEESDRISFRTGSYFGTKKVFNIGAGFFYHPNGSVIIDGNNNLVGQDVNIYGLDVYYDAPINSKNDAISFYGLFQNMYYGKNFNLSQYNTDLFPIAAPGLNSSASLPFANGNLQYMLLSYFNRKLKLQPYGYFQNRYIDATNDNERIFGIGANYHILGPNVRLTAEYRTKKLADFDSTNLMVLQLIFFM